MATPFDYKFPVPATDPSCKVSFTQTFHHKDWVDGQDVVQAGPSDDDDGFNRRLHNIENDLAAIRTDLATAVAAVNVLRSQLVEVLGEIKTRLNAPPDKTAKEGKDVKDFKDGKDAKDGKDGKDTKDAKDGKDGKDAKDAKDGKDGKDAKDAKDGKDHKDGKDGKDAKEKEGKEAVWGAIENDPTRVPRERLAPDLASFLWADATPTGEAPAGRAFIRPDERPPVGERALAAVDAALATVGERVDKTQQELVAMQAERAARPDELSR